jgi:hypothetical protein
MVGRPASEWFAARGLKPTDCGLNSEADIQLCALFPALPLAKIDGAFIEWMFATKPAARPDFAARWKNADPLVGATTLRERQNEPRAYAQRAELGRAHARCH